MVKTKRFIINADDCGLSQTVNKSIETAIKDGKITSTTIMANMDGFDGAVALYNRYKDHISFGWHINLDEGVPLTRSQILLDKGFFVEMDGQLTMNGQQFAKRYLDKAMRDEIKKELRAQWEKIKDCGIEITHADSHHFIHTQPSMIQIMPALFHELKINKCRHVANYGAYGFRGMAKMAWSSYYRASGIRMPDTFCSFQDYYNNPSLCQGDTIELMCHPGHPYYSQEYGLLSPDFFLSKGYKLITYKDL